MRSRTCYNIYDIDRKVISAGYIPGKSEDICIIFNEKIKAEELIVYVKADSENIFVTKCSILHAGEEDWIKISYSEIEPFLTSDSDLTLGIAFLGEEEGYILVNNAIEIEDKFFSPDYDRSSLYIKIMEMEQENMLHCLYYGTDGSLRIKTIPESERFNVMFNNRLTITCKNNLISSSILKLKRINAEYTSIIINGIATDVNQYEMDSDEDYLYLNLMKSAEALNADSEVCAVISHGNREYKVATAVYDIDKYINVYKVAGNREQIEIRGIIGDGIKEIVNIFLVRDEDFYADSERIQCSYTKILLENRNAIEVSCKTDGICEKGGRWHFEAELKDESCIPLRIYGNTYIDKIKNKFNNCNIPNIGLRYFVHDNLLILENGYTRECFRDANVQAEIMEDTKPKGEMDGRYVVIEDGRVFIELYQDLRDVIKQKLVLYNDDRGGILAYSELDTVSNYFEFKDFEYKRFEMVTKPVDDLWMRLCIISETYDGRIYFSYIKNFNKKFNIFQAGRITDFRALFLRPIGIYNFQNKDMLVVPYYSQAGTLSYRLIIEKKLYRPQFTNEILKVKIKHGIMTVVMKCRIYQNINYNGIILEYRKVREEDAQEYFIPYDKLVIKDNHYIMTAKVDLKEHYMRMLYWDIRCAFTVSDKQYSVTVHTNNIKLKKKYSGVFIDRFYPTKESILFPYATGNDSVALMHRESCKQDHAGFRFKEKFGEFLYRNFKKHYDKKEIYLVFEKYCTMAQDNGIYFFDYCMNSEEVRQSGKNIFYVLDSKAADWKNVAKYKKNVIRYLSLKHIIYLQACKLMISTDTKGHAYVWRSMGSNIKKLSYEKPLCFLQHGVTAFKRGHFEKGTNVGCELFITTSDFEHNIIRDNLGYRDEEIPVTGFARWDVLKDKSDNHKASHKEILMMPTWRTWLDDAENEIFAQSDYCINYMSLLNNKDLGDILKSNGVILNFYLHPKFRKFITEFSVVSENIRLISFGEEQLNELMMSCDMFITDFSSVAWDIYYMKKPVLFYHFDMDTAANTLGFYMDMENDLYGDIARTPKELMTLIVEYIGNDMKIKEKYLEKHGYYYKYIDDNNSERIFRAIVEWEK